MLITAPWFTDEFLLKLQDKFQVSTNSMDRWYTEEELIRIMKDYDAVIAGLDPFTQRVLENSKKLKIIARRGIGYDKIDLETCRRKGIVVTNTPVPEEHEAVAEFTLGLILDLTRNISTSSSSLKKGSWKRSNFLGLGLKDLTVGVIGLGHIGKKVAEFLKLLGCNVIYSDPYVNDDRFLKVGIEELFSKANVVTIHTPKSNETINLVNGDLLKRMKKGSFIINTSRAEVVNLEDLWVYLQNGTISNVALDVFPVEPPGNLNFISNRDVITTPHIAAFTKSSFHRIDEICYNNVVNVLLNSTLPDFIVNP